MTSRPETTIAALEDEQRLLVLPRFDERDAWRLGSLITARALEEDLGVAIDVRRAGLILFRAALPGSKPDQEEWIRRKAGLAFRLEASTLLLRKQFAAAGIDPTDGWLPSADHAFAGGAVPVRVQGVGVVAVATVSGLPDDEEDHRLVADGLTALLQEMDGSES